MFVLLASLLSSQQGCRQQAPTAGRQAKKWLCGAISVTGLANLVACAIQHLHNGYRPKGRLQIHIGESCGVSGVFVLEPFDVQLDGNAAPTIVTFLIMSRLDRQNPPVTSPIVVACHTSP